MGRVNLRFVDRETGEGREEGATRPEVILRQMSTRPGQVRRPAHWDSTCTSGCLHDVCVTDASSLHLPVSEEGSREGPHLGLENHAGVQHEAGAGRH